MPGKKNYTIYAAPRAPDGRYRRCEEKPLHLRNFESLAAMKSYWAQKIVPATSTTFGLGYEFSMVEADHDTWDFLGDPRYAEEPVLSGDKAVGANIYEENV